jgi:hypothetical protein
MSTKKMTVPNRFGEETGDFTQHQPGTKKPYDEQPITRPIGKIVTVQNVHELLVEQTGYNPDSYEVQTTDGNIFEVMEAADLKLEVTRKSDETRIKDKTIINAVKKYRERTRN